MRAILSTAVWLGAVAAILALTSCGPRYGGGADNTDWAGMTAVGASLLAPRPVPVMPSALPQQCYRTGNYLRCW